MIQLQLNAHKKIVSLPWISISLWLKKATTKFAGQFRKYTKLTRLKSSDVYCEVVSVRDNNGRERGDREGGATVSQRR